MSEMVATRNPAAIYTQRTARKTYRCEGAFCRRKIEPGDRYTRAALPPWKDVNASDSWWTLNLCSNCTPEAP